jgi:protein-L-isoaspartate(D-aspartate) O-methyltransferase
MEGHIKTKSVEKAFLETPRELFVPEKLKGYAYVDTPLEIGNGQTISAPHMVAIMCEALDLKKGQKILEIGAGSGYHAAVVSKLIGDKGHVYTIERFPSLADNAKKNLEKVGIKNVTVEIGDGSEGLPKYAPYDSIYVTCAAPCIPQPLVEQLKDPGKLLIPVGQFISKLELLEKKNKKIIEKDLGGCAFVPLVGKHGY